MFGLGVRGHRRRVMNLAEPRPTIRRFTARRRLLGGLVACTLMTLAVSRDAPMAMESSADNPIVSENQQPGSNGWMPATLGNDVAQQIKGYASTTSVNQGENINFYVTVNPAQSYTLDIYRMGWYGGLGGRLRLHVALDGVQQPPCTSDPDTGLFACNWTPAYSLTVPTDWTSGIYLGL